MSPDWIKGEKRKYLEAFLQQHRHYSPFDVSLGGRLSQLSNASPVV